jgi:2-polyprenyl-6-methoxyphenol hydroxylase-like FAD-dependent oxidoreductase
MEARTRYDVLIVGAGPSGLVLALWLNRLGIGVRILDKATGPGTTSRALAVQARTLELYRQLDLADAVVAGGNRGDVMNMHVEGKLKARIPLGAIGKGLTPFPYVEIFPQDAHERLLVERLAAVGVSVERNAELLDFTDLGTHVSARYRNARGVEDSCEALFIAGCDGARSVVREQVGGGFPGGTYRQVFYVADVWGHGPVMNGEFHIDLEGSDFLLVFAMEKGRRVRLVGVVSDERAEHAETLTFDDVSKTGIGRMNLVVDKVDWFSTYHVHHRVAEHFRKGRAFLVGDAGHIHSPAGGQGMNTGIGDAINLAWKLAAVVHNKAPDRLLDSYEAERLPFARQLVQTTDRVFTLATSPGRLARFVRTRIFPLGLAMGVRVPAVRRFLFRTVSQTMLHYRGGPISAGVAGRVHGGDRLPWVPAAVGDNFDSLNAMGWLVHVYGRATPQLMQWCIAHSVSLQVFEWASEHERAGLARDALYLLRPDSYVALADPAGSPVALERYFKDGGISIGNA